MQWPTNILQVIFLQVSSTWEIFIGEILHMPVSALLVSLTCQIFTGEEPVWYGLLVHYR